MGTLGQMLQATSDAKFKAKRMTVEQIAAREAKRVKTKVDSLTQAIEKAKTDITAAIRAGKDEFNISSKVTDRATLEGMDPAYAYLRRLIDKRNFPDDVIVQLYWNQFLAWAKSEDLRIELVDHLPDLVEGEQVGNCYVLIKARPVNSPY